MTTHEDFNREIESNGPSDRNFGLVVGLAFLVIGIAPLRHGRPVRLWSLILSGVLLLLALIRPALLRSLNRVWMRFGRLLGRITNPVLTALLFLLVFTPAAIILRLLGKDPLRRALDPRADTYWEPRGPSSIESSMANEF